MTVLILVLTRLKRILRKKNNMPIIALLVIHLHLSILFSDNASKDCSYTNLQPWEEVYGCYIQDKNSIVLQLGTYNQDWTLAHEIGHRLFLKDNEVKNIIKNYPYLHYENSNINEKVADYFADYVYDKDFSIKYPELQLLFNKKMKQYE